MSIMIRRVATDRAMLRAKDGADELGFSLDELYDLGKTIFAFLGKNAVEPPIYRAQQNSITTGKSLDALENATEMWQRMGLVDETFRDYLLRRASRPVRHVIERAIRAEHV